ncbi:G-protein coupled receptor [Biomphalaria glabrata]|nr:G-protein coupled receptor [Biomphalaria glabrata]
MLTDFTPGSMTTTKTSIVYTMGRMSEINMTATKFKDWTLTNESSENIVTWDSRVAFHWYLSVIVNPIIGLLGIVGNSINLYVLKRNGLHKPSNVLLYGLAIADICTVATAVDVVGILSQFPMKPGISWGVLEFDCQHTQLASFYLNFMRVMHFFGIFGANVSPCICVLVTLERIVAVFLPLKFASIVRPKRTWALLLSVSILWLAFTIMIISEFRLHYEYLPDYNVCFCYYRIILSETEVEVDVVATWLAFYVSLGIIISGSSLIYVKLKLIGIKRQKLTSSVSAHSSRTTITLLTVCLVFSVTQIIRFPYAMFTLPFESSTSKAMYSMFLETTSYLSSAANFIIYVIMNKKFRIILKSLCLSN